MAIRTPNIVYRDYETDGVPSSGEHNPQKAEIRALLNQMQVTGGSLVTTETKADLDAITDKDDFTGGLVLNDPTVTNNGYYIWETAAWTRQRGLPDTLALLTGVSGTNTITASVGSGVDPAITVAFVLIAANTNTGAVTLNVSGSGAQDLVDRNGDALATGALVSGRAYLVFDDGSDYRLLNDDDRILPFQGAYAAPTTYELGDLAENGGSIWYSLQDNNTGNTPTEGAYWTLFLPGSSVADGSVTEAKLADNAVTNAKLSVSHSLSLSHTVASRTALKALDVARYKTVFLQESGREGWFEILAGTPPTDTQEGIYVVLDTAGYYAKRIFDGPILDGWFGVVADDATDDTTAMKGLAAYMKANGGHYAFDGGTRRVWPTLPTTGDILMDVRGTNGLTVEYLNGASIHAIRPNSTTDSGSVEAIVWEITGCTNFTCINPKLEQEGAKVPPFTDGVFHFVGNYTSSAKTEGVLVTGVDQTGGIGGLVMRSPSSSAEADISRDIHFEGKLDKVYYPFNLQGNGNDAHAKIKATGCGRSFFVYNVRNVFGNITSDNNSGFDDVNISSYTDTIYQNETSNVHVNYTCRGHSNVSGAGLSAINFVQSDATSRSAKIRDISIHFDVDISTHGGTAINIRKYNHLGALDGTARGYALRDISFSGLISSGSSGFQIDPLNVMSGSSWSGETVYNIEFDQLEFQDAGSNALNINGAGINTIGGHIVFKECYFDSALTLSNMTGKLTVQGSRLGGKYYDGDYSGWKVTHKPKGRVTLTYQGQSIATGGGTTVTLPFADATGANPSVVVTPVSGVAAAFGVNPISSSSFGVLHDQVGSQNFNIHVEMNY